MRDNDAERFARIDALMEEYRIRHEDLQAYLESVRDRADRSREDSRKTLEAARKNATERRR